MTIRKKSASVIVAVFSPFWIQAECGAQPKNLATPQVERAVAPQSNGAAGQHPKGAAVSQPRYEPQDRELLQKAQSHLGARPDLYAILAAGLEAYRSGDQSTGVGRALQAISLSHSDSESMRSGIPLLSEINTKLVAANRYSQSEDLLNQATKLAESKAFVISALTLKENQLVTLARKSRRADFIATISSINKLLEPLLTKKLSPDDAENFQSFLITCPIFVNSGAGQLFADQAEAGPPLVKFRELVKPAKP